ncbi:MAG: hypothetical protein ACLPSW_21935 [Roseiarcus sp.]
MRFSERQCSAKSRPVERRGEARPDRPRRRRALSDPVPFVNGYIRGREGMSWSEAAAT